MDSAYNPREDDKEYVGTTILDQIENGAIGGWQWLQNKMADDPNRWDDDVWRFMGQRVGGALIGGGVGSFGGPKGALVGGAVGGILGAERASKLLGSIPGMQQLGQAQEQLVGGARELNEKLTPWLDPRVAGWGTRVLSDYLLERGVRSGVSKADKAWQIHQLQKGRGRFGQKLTYPETPSQQLTQGDLGIVAQMRNNVDRGRQLGELDFRKAFPDLVDDPYALERLEEAFARRLLGNQPDGYNYLGEFRKIWNRESRNWGFMHVLADETGSGYVEHMIAKGSWMDWFWQLPDSVRPYRPGSRHSVENVRLLFNRRYESLKNVIESITYGRPWRAGGASINFQRDPLKRIIIDIDDPMPKGGRIGYESVLNRQTPGDLIFRVAGTGEVVGRVGDFMDMIYAPEELLIPALIKDGIISEFTKAGRRKSPKSLVKSMRKWRRQVLERRINDIIYPNARQPNAFYSIDGIEELLDQYPFLADIRQAGYQVLTEDNIPDPRWAVPLNEYQFQAIVEELKEHLMILKSKQFSIRNKPTERLERAIRETEAELKLWEGRL